MINFAKLIDYYMIIDHNFDTMIDMQILTVRKIIIKTNMSYDEER